jgi:hypothetical protein
VLFVLVAAWFPFGDVGLEVIPVGVAARGECLPTAASTRQIPIVRSFRTALANSVKRRCSLVTI